MPRTVLPATRHSECVAVDRSDRAPAPIAPRRAHLQVVGDAPNRSDTGGAGAAQHARLSPGRPTAAGTPPAIGWWPRLISRSATSAAREAMATAAAVFSAPLSLVAEIVSGTGVHHETRPVPHVQGPSDSPVVLVHGFAASRTCWFALRRALRADGRIVLSFNYSPRASSVDELADRLTETVEELLAVTGARKVHLIGHSLGGVIIALALTGHRLAGRVDLVATLGSPFGGSPLAGLLPIGPLVRALRPGSPLLGRLAAARPPVGVRWLAFASTVDPIVPADRAVPANRQATLVTIDGAGHSGMLLDPEVIARIGAACGSSANGSPPPSASDRLDRAG
jgi:triacylglycerol lipase